MTVNKASDWLIHNLGTVRQEIAFLEKCSFEKEKFRLLITRRSSIGKLKKLHCNLKLHPTSLDRLGSISAAPSQRLVIEPIDRPNLKQT